MLVLGGAVTTLTGYALDWLSSAEGMTSGDQGGPVGSSGGGDTSGGSGSGEDVLQIPETVITGTASGVDPTTITDAPPLDVGTIEIIADPVDDGVPDDGSAGGESGGGG